MIRTVLAVAVAAGLLAVALPAVDSARVAHADRTVEDEASRLTDGLDRLSRYSDPTRQSVPGARWVLTLRLPARTWGTTGVREFHVVAGDPGRLVWRVQGGRHQSVRLDHTVVGGDVVLGPGRHRLVVRPVVTDEGVALTVVRAGGSGENTRTGHRSRGTEVQIGGRGQLPHDAGSTPR